MRRVSLLVVLSLGYGCVIEMQERVPADSGTQPVADLDPNCGNGVVDPGERCDIGLLPGAAGGCPKSCDDGLACTADAIVGTYCGAECVSTPISSCVNGDGCCPGGCDASSDDDCSKDCGNGVLDGKESCDTKIAAGTPGACPESCDDGNGCTEDTLLNGQTCAAQCAHTPITDCKAGAGDGCCPAGCTVATDADCVPNCGNGLVETGEFCDTAIAAGQLGACPTSCGDGKACTADKLVNAGTCNAQCSNTPITQCQAGDGCCPAGCNANNDGDCSAVCGNGVVESGEKCDGNCPTSCTPPATCKTATLVGSGCQRSCSTGTAGDGTSCTGGKCYAGSCCTGCWDGAACSTGTTKSKCGRGGVVCDTCVYTQSCCVMTQTCMVNCPQ